MIANLVVGTLVILLTVRAACFKAGVRRPTWIFAGRSAMAYWLLSIAFGFIFAAGYLESVPAIWSYLAGAVAALIGAIFEVVARHRAGSRRSEQSELVRGGT